jgi:predicted XRE-type DNA-binding protein
VRDNNRDRDERGRCRAAGGKGEKNGAAKLKDSEAAEIKRRYADGGVTQQQLADEYGVSRPLVSYIISGRIRAAS